MISVYNVTRSETLEQLKKRNRQLGILKITILTSLSILVMASIVIEIMWYILYEYNKKINPIEPPKPPPKPNDPFSRDNLEVANIVVEVSLMVVTITMICIFLKMYIHFL